MFCNFAVFCVLGLTLSRTFFLAQTDVQQIVDYGASYTSICLGASIGIFAQFCFERLLQSTGRTKLAMYTQIAGAVINIILDPILIFGWLGFPRMEVAGAALATVIGQIVAACLALFMNLEFNPDVRIRPSHIRFHWDTVKEIYRVGIPSIVMMSISSVDELRPQPDPHRLFHHGDRPSSASTSSSRALSSCRSSASITAWSRSSPTTTARESPSA